MPLPQSLRPQRRGQVIAADVSVVVVVTDAGADLNLRRMERYFAIIGKSGAKAVVLVNKSDLFPASKNQEAAEAIRAVNPAADVHITSAQKGASLKVLRQYLGRGVTLTLVGSSGVGKSSVTNYLVGEEFQWTDEVNEITGKGRHSTTARELIVLPGGGILIDNPRHPRVNRWTSLSAGAVAENGPSEASRHRGAGRTLQVSRLQTRDRRRLRHPRRHGGRQAGACPF